MSDQPSAISHLEGRGLPLRGDDIDTDPDHAGAFPEGGVVRGSRTPRVRDDRLADPSHPFNNKTFAGASMLVVNANFGCGSSREHAPQGLLRAGFRATVGESFSEIFLGNSAMIGPALSGGAERCGRSPADVDRARARDSDRDGCGVRRRHRGRASRRGCDRSGAAGRVFCRASGIRPVMLLNHFEDVRAVAAAALHSRSSRALSLFPRPRRGRHPPRATGALSGRPGSPDAGATPGDRHATSRPRGDLGDGTSAGQITPRRPSVPPRA